MTHFSKVAFALYHLAKRLHPEGVLRKAFVPVVVQGDALELRYFTDVRHGTDVEFCFFRPGTRYARRTVVVWSDGRAEPTDKGGVLLQSDKVPGEKPVSGSVDELVKIAYEALEAAALKRIAASPEECAVIEPWMLGKTAT